MQRLSGDGWRDRSAGGNRKVYLLSAATLGLLVVATAVALMGLRVKPGPAAIRPDPTAAGPRRIAPAVPEVQPDAEGRSSPPSDLSAAIRGNWLKLIVQSGSLAPLQGAAAYEVREGDTVARLGSTNAGGEMFLAKPTAAPTRFVIRAPGYCPGAVTVPIPAPDELLVVLDKGLSLSGQVTGRAEWGLEGLIVLAWEAGQSPTPARASRALSGDPRCASALTDSEGRFTIEGLRTTERYEVTAAGNGLFAPNIVAASPAEEVLIPVLPGFAGLVELVEQDGSALTCPDNVNGRGPTWMAREDALESLSSLNPAVVLGGIPHELCSSRRRYSMLLLYCADRSHAEVGPVEYAVTVPGYAPVDCELWLPRLHEQVQVLRIPVTSESRCKGTLEISFVSQPPRSALDLELMTGMGQVQLMERRKGGRRFSIGIWDWLDDVQTIPGLPCGEYDLRFALLPSFDSIPQSTEPPLRVLISEGLVAQAVLDLSTLGSLEIIAVDRRGQPFTGRATFRLRRRTPPSENFVGFHRGPYIIPGLLAGEYEVCPTGEVASVELATQRVFILEGTQVHTKVYLP